MPSRSNFTPAMDLYLPCQAANGSCMAWAPMTEKKEKGTLLIWKYWGGPISSPLPSKFLADAATSLLASLPTHPVTKIHLLITLTTIRTCIISCSMPFDRSLHTLFLLWHLSLGTSEYMAEWSLANMDSHSVIVQQAHSQAVSCKHHRLHFWRIPARQEQPQCHLTPICRSN